MDNPFLILFFCGKNKIFLIAYFHFIMGMPIMQAVNYMKYKTEPFTGAAYMKGFYVIFSGVFFRIAKSFVIQVFLCCPERQATLCFL